MHATTAPATIARSDDGHAWAEIDAAIIGPSGQRFTAGGAAYIAGQYLMAYAIPRAPRPDDSELAMIRRRYDGGTLQTWNGETLCTYHIVSRWHTWTKYGRFEWQAIVCRYDGLDWHGRYCSDTGQLVRLRPYKGQTRKDA